MVGNEEYTVNLNLTALLDVLMNLLFFAMVGLAAEVASPQRDDALALPASQAEASLSEAMTISIGPHALWVDDESIVTVMAGGLPTRTPSNRIIEPLYRALMRRKSASRPAVQSDVIALRCDRDTPYALLHHVQNTAAEAGFTKFRMVVLMR